MGVRFRMMLSSMAKLSSDSLAFHILCDDGRVIHSTRNMRI